MPDAILAIETSTALGGVAVVRDGEVCFEKTFSSERSHNSQLFAPLREALAVAGDTLRAVVVGTGPASYTGVRIGIAAAQGIAVSREVPVIGLPSVLAMDARGGDAARLDHYHVCGDARRGAFFVMSVTRDRLETDLEMLDADGLRRRHGELHTAAPWFTFDARQPLGLEHVICISPSAAVLAIAAAKLTPAQLQELATKPLEPVYLSAPFVTMSRKGGLVSNGQL